MFTKMQSNVFRVTNDFESFPLLSEILKTNRLPGFKDTFDVCMDQGILEILGVLVSEFF